MPIKAGIIGLGVGEAHIKGYQAHPDCRVVALCDLDAQKLKRARGKYPDMVLTEKAEDILKDPHIDVVSIASYDNEHYKHIMMALEYDKHVFVEKPFCIYKHEAQSIRDSLRNKPHIKLSSNLILRKCPRFMELKKRVAGGDLGILFHVEGDYDYGRLWKITEGWRGQMEFYSVIYGGGVHIIDLLLWLTKEKVTEVASFGNNIASQGTQFKFNDSATGILKFESGTTGKISVHFGCVMPHFHHLSVFGTKGTFINGPAQGHYYFSRDPLKPEEITVQAYPGVAKGDLITQFVESIIEDKEPDVSTEDIFRTMSVCFALEESVNKGVQRVEYI